MTHIKWAAIANSEADSRLFFDGKKLLEQALDSDWSQTDVRRPAQCTRRPWDLLFRQGLDLLSCCDLLTGRLR